MLPIKFPPFFLQNPLNFFRKPVVKQECVLLGKGDQWSIRETLTQPSLGCLSITKHCSFGIILGPLVAVLDFAKINGNNALSKSTPRPLCTQE